MIASIWPKYRIVGIRQAELSWLIVVSCCLEHAGTRSLPFNALFPSITFLDIACFVTMWCTGLKRYGNQLSALFRPVWNSIRAFQELHLQRLSSRYKPLVGNWHMPYDEEAFECASIILFFFRGGSYF